MLMERALHLAAGKVCIAVRGPFPARILNLMSSRGLSFWALQWDGIGGFRCTLSRRDYGRLRRLTEGLDCEITVERRQGAPYFARRLRRRVVLSLTLALATAALALGSFCVWDIEIEGETALSDEEILRTLQKYGVGIGSFCRDIDQEWLRNHVLLELDELSWITVNIRGFRAQVQVRPRTPRPEIADERTPVNIVARRGGVIRKVETLVGEAVVLPGSTVKAGDLLISGVSDRGGQQVELLPARGRVEARTWYTLSASLPLTVREKRPLEEKTALSLVLGRRRIKICGSSRYAGAEYDKITERTKWELPGLLPLPVTMVRETIRFYDTAEAVRSAAAAKAEGEALLHSYLQSLLPEGGEVLAAVTAAEERGGRLTVTLRAECREQIGETAAIPQSTPNTEENADGTAH